MVTILTLAVLTRCMCIRFAKGLVCIFVRKFMAEQNSRREDPELSLQGQGQVNKFLF